MKIKTSITISEQLVSTIDEFIGKSQNRSQFMETATWEYIAKLRRGEQNQRDLEILNRCASHLNAETMDALSYQLPL